MTLGVIARLAASPGSAALASEAGSPGTARERAGDRVCPRPPLPAPAGAQPSLTPAHHQSHRHNGAVPCLLSCGKLGETGVEGLGRPHLSSVPAVPPGTQCHRRGTSDGNPWILALIPLQLCVWPILGLVKPFLSLGLSFPTSNS